MADLQGPLTTSSQTSWHFLEESRAPPAADLQGDFGTLDEHAPAQAVLCTQRLIDLSKGVNLHAGGGLSVCGQDSRRRLIDLAEGIHLYAGRPL